LLRLLLPLSDKVY